jgi:hypothetical protein
MSSVDHKPKWSNDETRPLSMAAQHVHAIMFAGTRPFKGHSLATQSVRLELWVSLEGGRSTSICWIQHMECAVE